MGNAPFIVRATLLGIALSAAAVPVSAQVHDHLKCYKMKDHLKLEAEGDLITPRFGHEYQCRVSKAQLYCVPSAKTNVSAIDTSTKLPIGLPLSGAPQAGDQICYKVKCPKPFNPLPDQDMTDQFGSRGLSKLKTSLLCVPAVQGTAYCGDGTIGPGEDCEPTSLGGATCTSLGFQPGALACAPGCTFDTSGCPLNPPPGSCGNGTIEGGESCDGADLGGASCATVGYPLGGSLACTSVCAYDASGCTRNFPATGQTKCWDGAGTMIACAGTGQDGDLQAGSTLLYVDNGDGTVTDENTGLTWEKLAADGSIHDVSNYYSWVSAIGVKVATLNTPPCFAGHCDWRLPNFRELESIVDLEHYDPAVAPAFSTACDLGCTVLSCSCTRGGSDPSFWSSTTPSFQPTSAFSINFDRGTMSFARDKDNDVMFVRAVRGGL